MKTNKQISDDANHAATDHEESRANSTKAAFRTWKQGGSKPWDTSTAGWSGLSTLWIPAT